MTAIDEIAAERERQKSVEGWTAEHDDKHNHEEMASAAACYAMPRSFRRLAMPYVDDVLSRLWPWDSKWWKPGPRRRDLVKAGALIVAEIERLDRADAAKATGLDQRTMDQEMLAAPRWLRLGGATLACVVVLWAVCEDVAWGGIVLGFDEVTGASNSSIDSRAESGWLFLLIVGGGLLLLVLYAGPKRW